MRNRDRLGGSQRGASSPRRSAEEGSLKSVAVMVLSVQAGDHRAAWHDQANDVDSDLRLGPGDTRMAP